MVGWFLAYQDIGYLFSIVSGQILRYLKAGFEQILEFQYQEETCIFVLFDLILYVSSTNFQLNRDGSSWVEPVLS